MSDTVLPIILDAHPIPYSHRPIPSLFEGAQEKAHLDMAEIAVIAAETGITTMGAFRVGDMCLGRQGCPLFSTLDSLLLTHPTLNRACQNIGGIANFSVRPLIAPATPLAY